MTDNPVFAPGLFAGRHVLVTGGATGIGFGIARELGGLGARVTLASRDPAKLDDAVARLRTEGIAAARQVLNIRDAAAIEALFATLAATGDLPDALINNAGGQFSAPALETSANGFRAILDLNLPEMDGLDVLRSMRARQNKAAVLILTARGTQEEKIKGLDLGADFGGAAGMRPQSLDFFRR